MSTMPSIEYWETTAAAVLETVAETVAETAAAEIPPVTETIPQVIEVVESTEVLELLTQISGSVLNMEILLSYVSGVAVFFAVVALCYFSYRFFRIFI